LYPEELGVGRPYVVDERIEDYVEALCMLRLGKTQNVENALEKIEKFTLSNNQKTNSSDYISMLSFDYIYVLTLKLLEREEEIDSFLINWKKRSNNSLSYQWAVAIHNKDDVKMKELEKMIIGKGNSIWSPNGVIPMILLTKKVISIDE